MGRCKTWILHWTHELTDIWTSDKAKINTYAMYPLQLCLCSVVPVEDLETEYNCGCLYSTLKCSALSILSILASKPQVMLKLIHFHNTGRVPIQFASNFIVPCMDIVRSDHRF